MAAVPQRQLAVYPAAASRGDLATCTSATPDRASSERNSMLDRRQTTEDGDSKKRRNWWPVVRLLGILVRILIIAWHPWDNS